ncbi:FtsJ-like methyltransferase-domain-containing protein [Jimgerdemannia flammicorona]|uniref:rRNA methyltransferase 2, mitochondrial n=1 Tax=Jimgerdemannia flammicorona TaxID=994334 RepID=A0A433QH53_9FUNG|nr:FtsJ-like methyltransferase-domain-containing protein [Jimgerdemannia flammicorona]
MDRSLARLVHHPFAPPLQLYQAERALGLLPRHYSSSSKQWLTRQRNDPFVKAAQSQHYRARSAFKLVQVNEKHKFLRRGAVVVDCGAAPGGWAQVAAEKVIKRRRIVEELEGGDNGSRGSNGNDSNKSASRESVDKDNSTTDLRDGMVIAIDLLPIEPIPNVTIIQADFLEHKTQANVRRALGNRQVDVVCSDMAPLFSGNHSADHARSMELCESALDFAEKVLKPGGTFLCKVSQCHQPLISLLPSCQFYQFIARLTIAISQFLMGGTEQELKQSLHSRFRIVRHEKPEASRKKSTEGFFLCLGFGEGKARVA